MIELKFAYYGIALLSYKQ